MSSDERIQALDARVERLTLAPHEIGGVFERVFGGLYRLVGWQARFSTSRLRALMSEIGLEPEADEKLLSRALDEAEDNVDLGARGRRPRVCPYCARLVAVARARHAAQGRGAR